MDQGGVQLTVGWDGARISAAAVDCHRPQAARLLAGRPVAEAVALAPRLFSLCGCAQGAAARLAAAAAEGRDEAGEVQALMMRSVVLEAIGEHLWRLLLDWPALLGAPAEKSTFLEWRKRLLAVQASGSLPEEVLALAADLRAWLAGRPSNPLCGDRSNAPPVTLLPWCSAEDWAAVVIDDEFAQAPTLGGESAETGALARQSDVPEVADLLVDNRRVAARIAARWADLDFLADGLAEPGLLGGWLDSAPVGPGVGLARVETARGLLLHLMQVKDGRVERYVIVAPTEWNFHAQGAFAGEIVGAAATTRDEAERLARRLALALDPCVSYEVRIEDA